MGVSFGETDLRISPKLDPPVVEFLRNSNRSQSRRDWTKVGSFGETDLRGALMPRRFATNIRFYAQQGVQPVAERRAAYQSLWVAHLNPVG